MEHYANIQGGDLYTTICEQGALPILKRHMETRGNEHVQ